MSEAERTLHEKYMQRCIQLALRGQNFTSPNPMVGAVIVFEDKIIGEGYHKAFGQPHAEVIAIASVVDKSLFPKSTLYVSLEPCAHYGKTPPCANLIVKNKIGKVVIGSSDPHDLVRGKGIDILKKAGINVLYHILQEECNVLNKRFFCFHTKKRPYVLLKWAQSIDRFLEPERDVDNEEGIIWISSANSKKWVHQQRAKETAILVGHKTAVIDNPELTVREVDGNHPLRIVLTDFSPKMMQAKMLTDGQKTVLVGKNVSKFRTSENQSFLTLVDVEERHNQLQRLCEVLYEANCLSLIIEGGARTLQRFIDAGLWDEATFCTGQTYFGAGTLAPTLKGKYIGQFQYAGDTFTKILNA